MHRNKTIAMNKWKLIQQGWVHAHYFSRWPKFRYIRMGFYKHHRNVGISLLTQIRAIRNENWHRRERAIRRENR